MRTIQFDKKCKCGPEFVCVRVLENCDELKVGDIFLPVNAEANGRLAYCQVEDIGWKAAKTIGVSIGEYVMIDRLSTFSHTFPVALLKYDSVIMKTDKAKSEFWPLLNTLFVEPEKNEAVSNVGGVYVPNYAEKIRLGTISKMNVDVELKVPFKEGDKVMLVKGGDHVQLGDTEVYIYKPDMIVCTIEEEVEK